MKNIAIIFGGESSEYSVSLHSAASVIKEIDPEKFNVTLIGITTKGEWKLYEGTVEAIDNDTWHTNDNKDVTIKFGQLGGFYVDDEKLTVDVAFPVLHGKNGEDGSIQGVFELAHIPYIGCNIIASAMSLDKEVTHIICEDKGIRMAPYVAINYFDDVNEKMNTINNTLHYPLFVKPSNVGSSYGITKVYNTNDLLPAIEKAFEYDKKLLVEQGIEGFEIGCAVLGNDELIVGEVDHIDTTQDFFDFEGKYNLKNTTIHCPAKINETLKTQAKEKAKVIYRLLQCSGLARVDMFVDQNNDLVFNEINTLPGFTSASRYPTMMKKIGISYKQLIEKLYDLALEKYEK